MDQVKPAKKVSVKNKSIHDYHFSSVVVLKRSGNHEVINVGVLGPVICRSRKNIGLTTCNTILHSIKRVLKIMRDGIDLLTTNFIN